MPRLFAYCGRGGETATGALASVRAMAPGCEIYGAESGPLGESFTAFGLVANDAPALARASTPDGSFLLIDGFLLEDRYAASRLLNRWLDMGNLAFEEFRFRGVIVAWNAATATCVLLRDPDGVAPLFFTETEAAVVISSELPTLIDFGVAASPNPEAIDAFVTAGHFPAPLTPIDGISKLPPGHVVSVTAEGASSSSPWSEYFAPDPIKRGGRQGVDRKPV